MSFKKYDRVRFIDNDKNIEYGVLIVFDIKGDYATIGSGSYETLGHNILTVLLTEIKKEKPIHSDLYLIEVSEISELNEVNPAVPR